MTILRERIPTPAAEASASYDFEDVEEGIGFVSFNAATTSGSAIITRRLVYSNTLETSVSTLSGSHWKEIDIDFDTAAFNLPRTIKGTAFISIPMAIQSQAAGARKDGYTIAEVKHWDGTTETSLGRSTSGSYLLSPVGNGAKGGQVQLHKIALTQKTFKAEDILRVTVEAYSIAGSTAGMGIGHDPQGRTDPENLFSGSTTVTTKLIADIPFKLDL